MVTGNECMLNIEFSSLQYLLSGVANIKILFLHTMYFITLIQIEKER